MRANVFFVTASIIIFGTLLLKSMLFVYSLFLLTVLYVAYYAKANGHEPHKGVIAPLVKSYRRQRYKGRLKIRKRILKEKFLKPRPLRMFIPLMIFLVIIYLFLSHTVFFAVITSDSMDPAFKTGDLVLLQNADLDITEGDIIMFSVPSQRDLIIHRVESVEPDGIYTVGDATGQVDDWVVEEDDIEGEVVAVGGYSAVLKGVGWYFIENAPSSAPFSGELHFTSLMLVSLKNIGILIFMIAIMLYIMLTARDLQYQSAHKRRR
ncbi:MAG: signal peptidase I [Thermoplasmata archaeon]|nr:signal peptidase I [Thermoplasmata archaeon]